MRRCCPAASCTSCTLTDGPALTVTPLSGYLHSCKPFDKSKAFTSVFRDDVNDSLILHKTRARHFNGTNIRKRRQCR